MKLRIYMLQMAVYTDVFTDTINTKSGDCRHHARVADRPKLFKGEVNMFLSNMI